MANVTWVKIAIDTFSDEKVRLIHASPEGDGIMLIWIRLILLAGKINDNGYIYLQPETPYTIEELSVIMGRPESLINKALSTFKRYGMLEEDEKGLFLVNFEKHQNTAGLERIKEQNRERVRRYRNKSNDEAVTPCNVTVTLRNATEEEREEEGERERDKEEEAIREGGTCPSPVPTDPVPYSEITALYNEQCHGLPKVKALTEMRRRTIRARWNANKDNPAGHFRELFEKAGKSDFLNGINDRAWIADFDWLMKEQNAVKVLEGKYDNSARAPAGLKPMRGQAVPAETQQQKNNRILDEMYARAKAEEERHANDQDSDYPALEADKYDIPG